MLVGCFIIHRDYGVPLKSRMPGEEHPNHPRCELGTLLRNDNWGLPIVPYEMV